MRSINNHLNYMKEKAYSPFLLYTLFVTLIYVLPYMKFKLPYIPVAFLMLASLAIFVIKKTTFLNYGILLIGLSFFWMLLYFSDPINGINEFVRNVRFFIPVIWGCYCLQNCNQKQKRLFLILFAILIGYFLIKTMRALSINQWISRVLAQDKSTSSNEINAYRLQNIGGFEFSYMMGVIDICFMWLALNSRKILSKIVSYVLTVIIFYYIVQTMYTTLLILAFLGIVVLLILQAKKTSAKIIISGICIVILFITLNLINFIGNLFPKESLLFDKFNMIHQALVSNDIYKVGNRPKLMLQGLQIWWEYPLFGSGGKDVLSHSTWVSALSNSGIVGFSILIMLHFQSRKLIIKYLREDESNTTLFNVSFLYLIALAILNPIGYIFELSITVFFIVPLFSSFFSKKNINKEKL